MILENFDECLKLAKEYLPTKERKNYYYFKTITEPYPEYTYFLQPIDDAELPALKSLKEKYGEQFPKHLDEVYDDPDVISDFICGDEFIDVDLDTIAHMYTFKTHEVKPDGTIFSFNISVELSDEEYAQLIAWHLLYNHTTSNTLRYQDQKLYDRIWREVDHRVSDDGCIMTDYPYTVTFDEVLADVDIITRQHNIKYIEGYCCLGI